MTSPEHEEVGGRDLVILDISPLPPYPPTPTKPCNKELSPDKTKQNKNKQKTTLDIIKSTTPVLILFSLNIDIFFLHQKN